MNSISSDSSPHTITQPTSAFPQIFISYSRREFYFAESLSIRLQHSGMSVWFDSQQIALGENWSQDIQSGLSESGTLVLVASQASIASPYVAKEWQYALEKGKPVHVIFFEAVDLPAELTKSAASIIDGRSGFEVNYPRLVANIKGETTIRDPMPTKASFGLPTKLSPSLQALVVSRIGLSLIFSLFIWIDILPLVQNNQQAILFVAAGLIMFVLFIIRPLVVLWRILRRNFVHQDVISVTAYREVLILVLAVSYLLFTNVQIPKTNTIILAVITGIYLLYWWRFVRPAKWNIDILNWYPLTAQPPTEWRAIVQRPYLNSELDIQLTAPVVSGAEPQYPILTKPAAPKSVEPKPPTKWFEIKVEQTKPEPAAPAVITRAHSTLKGTYYHVYHAPADTAAADQFKKSLWKFGLRETADLEKADYIMLYLSHRTSKAFAYQLSEQHPNLICILAESIKMPEDVPASFKGIQWFDYRARQSDRLYAALDALGDTSESVRAVQALNTLPPQLSAYKMSPELETVWNTFGCIGTSCLALGLTGLAFIVGVIVVGTLNIRVLLALLIVLVLLANAVFFYRTAWRAATYQPIRSNVVWLGLIGGTVLAIAIPWLATTISPIADFFGVLVIIIIAFFAWLPLAVRMAYWNSQKRFAADSDAFGTPGLRLSRNWLASQLLVLAVGVLGFNVLWTGKAAFAEFITKLMFGK